MGLRIFTAFLAVFFGTAAALAQSDTTIRNSPAAAATTDGATPKSAKKHARSKPKTEPKSESKSDAAAKDEPAPKQKSKSAEKKSRDKKSTEKKSGDRPDNASTTGSAGTATPEMKSSLREAFATIAPAERVALQSDLIWTGDFNGLIDGQFSDRLADAVAAYQKRHNSKPTGVLSAQERTALTASVRPKQNEVGWRVVDDPVTGARVGLPAKLATETARGVSGTRWSSAQGQLQIETFRIDTGATLDAVFEQQKKMPRRRISYQVLRPDFFVVSGMQGLKKMYVRGFAKDGEVRGITILYDQAMEGTIDPIVVAMSSAFVPFGNTAVASSADMPRRKVEYGTGIVVSTTGHIVTAQHVIDGCQVIAIPRLGHAERLVEDKDSGLALLRVYGAQGLAAIPLHGAAPDGDRVTLVGIADPQAQAGGDAITTATARLTGNALDQAPAPGFSGAAALDGQARMIGIAIQRSPMVAGSPTAPPATVVPVARIRAFLDANYVPPAAGRPGLDGAKDAIVRVVCVRK